MRNATLGAARPSSVRLRMYGMRFATLDDAKSPSVANHSLPPLPSMPPLTLTFARNQGSTSPSNTANGAPCGSRTAATRPIGVSIGPAMTLPPPARTAATASSHESTVK
jgi:hypothetical protein